MKSCFPIGKQIAEKIHRKRADYVVALKGNQAGLYEDVEMYFSDEKIRKEIQEKNDICTVEKAHDQMEKREYSCVCRGQLADYIVWINKMCYNCDK